MIEIYNNPLAILPDSFSDIEAISERLKHEAINTDSRFEKSDNFLQTKNGIAILNIFGAIISKGNRLSQFFGIADTETLAASFMRAENDPKINHIILNIDSPGGMVTGINEFQNMIRAAQKPTTAYIGGTGASAVYLIASAADRIIIDAMARVGGIGVVIGYRKDDGKTIEIVNTASPMKRVDIESDEGKKAIIAEADAIADVFISAVARNRKKTKEYVIENFGKGGVLVGKKAIEFGLADGIGALNHIITRIENKQRSYHIMEQIENITSVKQLAATFPDLITAIREEAIAGVNLETKIETAKKEATNQEKDRILGLAAIHFGDAGKKFGEIVGSGITSEQYEKVRAAIEDPASEKKKRLEAIMKTGAPDGINPSVKESEDFTAIVNGHRAKGMKYAEALAKSMKENPESHSAWINKINEGRG